MSWASLNHPALVEGNVQVFELCILQIDMDFYGLGHAALQETLR